MSPLRRIGGTFARSTQSADHTATHGSNHGTRTGGRLGPVRRFLA